MRKMATGMSLFTIAAAAAGYLLRKKELATVFDAETGLAQRWAPISIGLALVSVVFALGLLLFAARMGAVRAGGEYKDAFSPNSVAVTLALMLLGIGIAAASLYRIIYLFLLLPKDPLAYEAAGLAEAALYIFGIASGISFAVLARGAFRGGTGSEMSLCSIVPVVFLAFLLVLFYKERATDPVLLDYVYEFLAVCVSLLASYYAAGYAFGKPLPKRTAYFGYLAAYLWGVSLAGSHNIGDLIILICLMLTLFVNSHLLVGNTLPAAGEGTRAAKKA